MRKLEIKDADIMRIAVQQEILRNEESRYNHRLHGILLVCSGVSCIETAQILGHSPRTVQYWVQRFEKSGFTGLQEIPREGRHPVLDEQRLRNIGQDLRQSPRDMGYAQNLWDGKLLSHHLQQKHGIILGVRQCQRLFRRLGFRRRKPRPLLAKTDPELQRKYKKTQATGPQ